VCVCVCVKGDFQTDFVCLSVCPVKGCLYSRKVVQNVCWGVRTVETGKFSIFETPKH
jgi:hypothetical protein